jgi:hypothetical protein
VQRRCSLGDGCLRLEVVQPASTMMTLKRPSTPQKHQPPADASLRLAHRLACAAEGGGPAWTAQRRCTGGRGGPSLAAQHSTQRSMLCCAASSSGTSGGGIASPGLAPSLAGQVLVGVGKAAAQARQSVDSCRGMQASGTCRAAKSSPLKWHTLHREVGLPRAGPRPLSHQGVHSRAPCWLL